MAKARGDGELRAYLPGVVCQLADAVISYENLGRQLTPALIDRVLDLYFTRMDGPVPTTAPDSAEPSSSGIEPSSSTTEMEPAPV